MKSFSWVSSESNVDGDHPIPELRERGLLERGVAAARAAEEHRLRLEALITGPEREVATRDRHGCAVRPQPLGDGLWYVVRHRELTPAAEIRLRDEIIDDRAARVVPRRGHGVDVGLERGKVGELRRRERHEVREAAAKDAAAGARVAVHLLVTVLHIEHAEDVEAVEQGER